MYLQGVGWVNMDTFSERSEDPPSPEPSRELQRQLGDLAREDKTPDEIEAGAPFLTWAKLLWLLPVAGVVVVSLYTVKVWRRLAPHFAGELSLYRICYRAALDRLAEVGLCRQFGETREEFAQRLARLAPEFVALSEAHVRAAVGGMQSFTRETWLDLKARIDGAIARTFSFWRRLAGAANPVTWLWVR
jgi:hypothetical protein